MIPTAGDLPGARGAGPGPLGERGTTLLKRGFAHMLKGGVVMDVTGAEQAGVAEDAGAVAVMVLDKLPSDVRRDGGVARTAGMAAIREVSAAVSVPVMAKCRIGHTHEARVLADAGVDMVDESEVLTPADEDRHIWKWDFATPFVNGARSLGEALRRVEEGAAMIRTKGEPGTGDVAEAVRHVRAVTEGLRAARAASEDGDEQEVARLARRMRVSYSTAAGAARAGRLPVVNFAAGGIATPADAAQLMSLGCDGVFVGSGIFKAGDAARRAEAVVLAASHWRDAGRVREAQAMVDERSSMPGLDAASAGPRMQERGASA